MKSRSSLKLGKELGQNIEKACECITGKRPVATIFGKFIAHDNIEFLFIIFSYILWISAHNVIFVFNQIITDA